MSHPAGSVLLNRPSLLCVLVVESGITAARCGTRPAGTVLTRRTSMIARLGQSQPAHGADVIAREMAAMALAALAENHEFDHPASLGNGPIGSHRHYVHYLGTVHHV